ncbi:MAG: 2Fe-2S iron-sulfur cluster-binding protein [bacterium]|nr:2Fe-2S iron-sulfur cluster-binding protein [bacterium]
MPNISLDGNIFNAPDGWTILEAANFLGIEIPTLCYEEGLSAWGGCRLCLVEIGEGERAKLVTSCTYPVEEGLVIRTATKKVVESRKMIIELLIAQCPTSKTLQDLASKFGVQKIRFDPKWEDCIYCGLCVRICSEQMMAGAIGFAFRGDKLKITTPFDEKSEICRRCGGCMYICPACSQRCPGSDETKVLCGACYNSLQPTCLDIYDNYMCYEGLKGDCGTCIREKPEQKNIDTKKQK